MEPVLYPAAKIRTKNYNCPILVFGCAEWNCYHTVTCKGTYLFKENGRWGDTKKKYPNCKKVRCREVGNQAYIDPCVLCGILQLKKFMCHALLGSKIMATGTATLLKLHCRSLEVCLSIFFYLQLSSQQRGQQLRRTRPAERPTSQAKTTVGHLVISPLFRKYVRNYLTAFGSTTC